MIIKITMNNYHRVDCIEIDYESENVMHGSDIKNLGHAIGILTSAFEVAYQTAMYERQNKDKGE